MREVSIHNLEVGQCLDRDIFDSKGRLLLKRGIPLKEVFINSLKNKGIEQIYIESEDADADADKDKIDDNKIAELELSYEDDAAIKKVYDKLIYEMRRTTLRGTYKKLIQDNLRADITTLLNTLIIKEDDKVIRFLLRVKSIHIEYRYEAHSLNTGILSALIGKWLGDSSISLAELCLAGCLHDIGEFQIPRKIYDKKGTLSADEWECIKKHPLYGAQILDKTPWVSHRVLDAVIKHHERLDGTGYPLNCLGSEIPIMPRIIAVAGSYDAMTTTRSHARAVSQFAALGDLKDRSFGQLDPLITRLLYDKMLAFYLGKEVILNNGDIGKIVFWGPNKQRPYVKSEKGYYDLTLKDAPLIVSVKN